MSNKMNRIGFWHSQFTPGLPHPIESADAAWSAAERAAVVAYLRSRVDRTVTAYRRSSRCRICDCSNGSEELSDGVYLWPSGYAHYVEAHDVKPPQAFIDRVMAAKTSADRMVRFKDLIETYRAARVKADSSYRAVMFGDMPPRAHQHAMQELEHAARALADQISDTEAAELLDTVQMYGVARLETRRLPTVSPERAKASNGCIRAMWLIEDLAVKLVSRDD